MGRIINLISCCLFETKPMRKIWWKLKLQSKKEYYPNGRLETEIPYKDSKINGIEKRYYESGELQVETPWVDDKINGIVKTYYENGELKEEIFDDEIPF